MSIKFSQFTIETSPTSVSYLVGYYGGINVQITPDALLAGHIPYTGATTDVFLGTHTIHSAAFKILGGTNEQFLKADGTLDNNIYLTQSDLPTTLLLFATNAPSGINGYFKLVNTIDDPDYNTVPVNIQTGNITTADQFIAGLITTPNQISGNPGVFNITTIGNIRKAAGSGSGEATFFYRIYKRDNLGNETEVCVSDPTLPVGNGTYAEFQASGIFNDGIFGPTDSIVVKYYATRIEGGSDPAYEFQFGGDSPIRTVVPIPTSAIPNTSLEQLNDVYIDPMTLSNGNTLVYDAMSQLWKNGTGGGGGGITNYCEDNYIPYSGSSGTALDTSPLYVNGASVYVNTTSSPSMATLEVNGSLAVSGIANFNNALLYSNSNGQIQSQQSIFLTSTSIPGFNDNLSIGNAYPSYNSRLYIEEGYSTMDGAVRIVANNSFTTTDIVRVIDGSSNNLFSIRRKGAVSINKSNMYFTGTSSSLYIEQDMDSFDSVMTLFGKNYNDLFIGLDGANAEVIIIDNNGSITNSTGDYGSFSDIRLKENIIPATSKLDDLLKLNIVNYNLIRDNNKLKQIGVIAQELEQVFPGLVSEDKEGMKSVKYSIFVPMLIKAVQEQQAQIEELKQLINK